METLPSKEKKEKKQEKVICEKCGNDTFRIYITLIIDDARLYCANCGEYQA
jgi:ribosomal protein L37E